jgi:hypothetical protein
VTLSGDRQFAVHQLQESSKRGACGACRRACAFVQELANGAGFVAAAQLDAAGLARKAGLSARSSQAVLRALHQAMAELVFDYRDQVERARYAGRV